MTADSTRKEAALLELGRRRKTTRWPGYACIGDYHDGAYECDFVSPYTKSAGNVDAEIMFILQDWASADSLEAPLSQERISLGYTPTFPTNQTLVRLLLEHLGAALPDVYGTNLFPFVKPGGRNATIPARDLLRAAQEFALPQVAIVEPKLVICLGLPVFNAVRRASGLGACQPMEIAIAAPFTTSHSRVWCQAHPGMLGQNNRNRGGIDRVSSDWQRMKHDGGM